ncbi:nicastrin [Ischnura elegans]|uniref:nicastrin n=1 Tax=Ischnura elegans TaxID=197161 RepID=UPI001ED87514|nr:nicastrin [Ischnura elegans]
MVLLKVKMFSWTYLVFLMFIGVLVSAERTKDKMYEPILGAVACFRRLNGTHQFGCSSHRSGNVGVIHIVNGKEDLDWLLNEAPAQPYTAVVQPDMFTRDVMLKLKDSSKVNGVILINNQTILPRSFSHEDTCPNRYSGLSSLESQICNDEKPWNPYGTGLMLVDWGFPIFFVRDTDSIEKIFKCFEKHNSNLDGHLGRSLCAIETNAYMYAAVDSQTCVRRSSMVTNFNPVRVCDPLGDRNVWSTLFPLTHEPQTNSSYIILAARMDATSLFDGITPGARSPVSGLVTLLTSASLLSAMMNESMPNVENKNVLFLLLNGESYDYVGSSRLAWDMDRGAFPIRLEQISAFIELGQLFSPERNYFIHGDVDRLDNFTKIIVQQGKAINLNFMNANATSLPPASLQMFKHFSKGLPGLVLADFADHFTNRYYHSIFDNASLMKYKYANGSDIEPNSVQVLLSNVSSALAKSLYQYLTNEKYSGIGEDTAPLVDELLHCYLESSDCPIFRAATGPGRRSSTAPPSLYVGVNNWPNAGTTYTAQTLAYLTGTPMTDLSEAQCHPTAEDKYLYQYTWIRGINASYPGSSENGVCYRSTYNYSIAVSPAFEIEDYDWASGNFSTWTESVWKEFSVRIFLRPSRQHEIVTLCLGLVVLILSFIVVHFVSSRSGTLFCNSSGTNTLVVGC